MPADPANENKMTGLTNAEVERLREQYGPNVFTRRRSWRFLHILRGIALEPMFILLLLACSLYFVLGNTDEGILMLAAIVIVSGISVYQETKSNHAIAALQQLTAPRVDVLRNGEETVLEAAELVPGDIIFLSEGMMVPADAVLLAGNDCFVNESMVTGESVSVAKYAEEGKDQLFQGTMLDSGKCTARIAKTGNNTFLGQVGRSIDTYIDTVTLLQAQVRKFVRALALFGFACFVTVFAVNYFHHHNAITSLLFALTLAMSVVPEEIPVAFSSFMALGALRLSRLGIISRKPQVIENLGAVSVICLDKTGTITENKMEVKEVYDFSSRKIYSPDAADTAGMIPFLQYAALASETDPYDPMEKAIWDRYTALTGKGDYSPFHIKFEYPLEGRPPMMTHVHTGPDGESVGFAKGALERVLQVCRLREEDRRQVVKVGEKFAGNGYRVVGVAVAKSVPDALPVKQDDLQWEFAGILALYDPPKPGIAAVIGTLQKAGIHVKMLTGDHPVTANQIARLSGFKGADDFLTGAQVMNMTEDELKTAVYKTHIFARMFPDAKRKVIEVLKSRGEIVAMTGDGVNDGTALHTADIGIAMGRKGTEIARQAADMVITDDNLASLVTAVEEGRKIFLNLAKAVRYIISIHIPIILTASIPVIFAWKYPNIFSPVHVIFLELVMGPTCSIFFEREPVESGIMKQPPRLRSRSLFKAKELTASIFQGTITAAAVLFLYYFYMSGGASLGQTRNMVFTTILFSNLFLTFSNRSFTETILSTWKYRNPLAVWIPLITALLFLLLQFVPPITFLFEFEHIGIRSVLLSFATAITATVIVELRKKIVYQNKKAP